MAHHCPHCGLVNPLAAQRCDCGYDFGTHRMERSYLRSKPAKTDGFEIREARMSVGHILLVLGGVALGFLGAGRQLATGWPEFLRYLGWEHGAPVRHRILCQRSKRRLARVCEGFLLGRSNHVHSRRAAATIIPSLLPSDVFCFLVKSRHASSLLLRGCSGGFLNHLVPFMATLAFESPDWNVCRVTTARYVLGRYVALAFLTLLHGIRFPHHAPRSSRLSTGERLRSPVSLIVVLALE